MAEVMTLPARLDLTTGSTLAQDLSGRDLSAPIELDASDVTHFGALGVQVIMAAARDAKAAGGGLALSNVSPKVSEQLEAMGLTPETLVEGTA